MPGLKKTCPRKGGAHARAFSLVELLAVIVIVAILGAIAVVMTQRALAAGRSAACIGNLRQIGMAVQHYAMDHNGETPGYSWYYPIQGSNIATRGSLAPYIGAPRTRADYNESAFTCPELQSQWPSGLTARNTYTINGFCLSLGEYGDKLPANTSSQTPRTRHISESVNPAAQVIFFDGLPQNTMSGGTTWFYLSTGYASTASTYGRFPHHGACNAVFLDGHCESIPRDEFLAHSATSTFWIGR